MDEAVSASSSISGQISKYQDIVAAINTCADRFDVQFDNEEIFQDFVAKNELGNNLDKLETAVTKLSKICLLKLIAGSGQLQKFEMDLDHVEGSLSAARENAGRRFAPIPQPAAEKPELDERFMPPTSPLSVSFPSGSLDLNMGVVSDVGWRGDGGDGQPLFRKIEPGQARPQFWSRQSDFFIPAEGPVDSSFSTSFSEFYGFQAVATKLMSIVEEPPETPTASVVEESEQSSKRGRKDSKKKKTRERRKSKKPRKSSEEVSTSVSGAPEEASEAPIASVSGSAPPPPPEAPPPPPPVASGGAPPPPPPPPPGPMGGGGAPAAVGPVDPSAVSLKKVQPSAAPPPAPSAGLSHLDLIKSGQFHLRKVDLSAPKPAPKQKEVTNVDPNSLSVQDILQQAALIREAVRCSDSSSDEDSESESSVW